MPAATPGPRRPEQLIDELGRSACRWSAPAASARRAEFHHALSLGYAGVQLGTRFIATTECRASDAYKQAIVRADEKDIVLSERITGVPVAVINTPFIQRMGLKAGPIARWMLRGRRRKQLDALHLRSEIALAAQARLARRDGEKDYWQAGRSVAGIDSIEPAGDIVRRFAAG